MFYMHPSLSDVIRYYLLRKVDARTYYSLSSMSKYFYRLCTHTKMKKMMRKLLSSLVITDEYRMKIIKTYSPNGKEDGWRYCYDMRWEPVDLFYLDRWHQGKRIHSIRIARDVDGTYRPPIPFNFLYPSIDAEYLYPEGYLQKVSRGYIFGSSIDYYDASGKIIQRRRVWQTKPDKREWTPITHLSIQRCEPDIIIKTLVMILSFVCCVTDMPFTYSAYIRNHPNVNTFLVAGINGVFVGVGLIILRFGFQIIGFLFKQISSLY